MTQRDKKGGWRGKANRVQMRSPKPLALHNPDHLLGRLGGEKSQSNFVPFTREGVFLLVSYCFRVGKKATFETMALSARLDLASFTNIQRRVWVPGRGLQLRAVQRDQSDHRSQRGRREQHLELGEEEPRLRLQWCGQILERR